MEGWIKLHRKLLHSLIFGNEKGLKVWLWCLLKANHTPNTFLLGRQKVSLLAGQFIMGSNTAIDELRLAKATLWYWLHFLEEQGQVRLQKNAKYTVVTLLNWTDYQTQLDAGDTLKERWVGTNKNEKNEKNTSVAIAPQEYSIIQGNTEENTERVQKTKPKYPHAKEVFDWFPVPEKSWKINLTELKHAELLWERGEQKVKRALVYIENHKQDEKFYYTITKPSDLERKWNDIAEYAKRN